MKTRTLDTLASLGYVGSIEDFRTALLETKAELFRELSVDELIYTRDQAGDYCTAIRKRVGAPKLTRVVILRALVNVRKGKKHKV